MRDRTDNLGSRLGAVILVLLTAFAVVFGVLNFQQRSTFDLPDDGASWVDTSQGPEALYVAPGSAAERAGIEAGDRLIALNGAPVRRAVDVASRLWDAGVGAEIDYQIERDGSAFDARLVVAPAPKPLTLENYLRLVGVLYLCIGMFVFLRRWDAHHALHFCLFCLSSFVLFAFHYTGKLNAFDWEVYWSKTLALLLAPALLVHFALLFPERRVARKKWHRLWVAAVYLVPAALLLLHVDVATNLLGFAASWPARLSLDQLELSYLGLYFLLAAAIFLRSYLRAPRGALRQQLKWVTGGTLAGVLPFALLYILPYSLGVVPRPWMNLSVIFLALMPLCFAYAIVRYRLMDVDIIFKRGLAYAVATAVLLALWFGSAGLLGHLFHASWPGGLSGEVIAIIAAAFLFQPFRQWIQARLDRFFYRDRLNYRRTLIEFGRTLTTEVRLEPMLASVLDRLSQTLLVDRIAIFTEVGTAAAPGSGRFRLARSLGLGSAANRDAAASELHLAESRLLAAMNPSEIALSDTPFFESPFSEALDLSFLNPGRPEFSRGYLFYESARAVSEESESVRRTIELLRLHYFIPCRIHDHTVAILGLGKTVDGDFLSSEDVELLFTIAGYVAIALDNAQLYSSLEQKAQQIQRLKDFSENIVESLNVGVLAADVQGRIEFWNTKMEQLAGVLRERAVGRDLADVLPPELAAEIAARAAEERTASLYKFPMSNRDGQPLLLNVSIVPFADGAGEPGGRLILLADVTEQMRAEGQLVQTEKLTSLGLLAAGVAHEVNTPLAVISNYIQLLGKQLPPGDPRQALIEKIVKQTFRASDIVNHLLNFSRTAPAEFREVDVNQILEETLSLVAHPLRTSQVQVIRALQEDLPPVLGSGNRLQQVFLNLFLNARDAMPSGGMLEVRSNCSNGSVEIEVSDSGLGIATENISRIFDPFFTTKTNARGTGLGLSVSYGIIKEHGGKVEVRSTPGKGTSFRLEFPTARKAVHV